MPSKFGKVVKISDKEMQKRFSLAYMALDHLMSKEEWEEFYNKELLPLLDADKSEQALLLAERKANELEFIDEMKNQYDDSH